MNNDDQRRSNEERAKAIREFAAQAGIESELMDLSDDEIIAMIEKGKAKNNADDKLFRAFLMDDMVFGKNRIPALGKAGLFAFPSFSSMSDAIIEYATVRDACIASLVKLGATEEAAKNYIFGITEFMAKGIDNGGGVIE